MSVRNIVNSIETVGWALPTAESWWAMPTLQSPTRHPHADKPIGANGGPAILTPTGSHSSAQGAALGTRRHDNVVSPNGAQQPGAAPRYALSGLSVCSPLAYPGRCPGLMNYATSWLGSAAALSTMIPRWAMPTLQNTTMPRGRQNIAVGGTHAPFGAIHVGS
jgi:hypothetical protein